MPTINRGDGERVPKKHERQNTFADESAGTPAVRNADIGVALHSFPDTRHFRAQLDSMVAS